jgi:hypothetical protein
LALLSSAPSNFSCVIPVSKQSLVALQANPVARVIGGDLGRMPLQPQVIFPNFSPVPFYIRTGHPLTLNLFGIQMPSAASCTSNHLLSLNLKIASLDSHWNDSMNFPGCKDGSRQ